MPDITDDDDADDVNDDDDDDNTDVDAKPAPLPFLALPTYGAVRARKIAALDCPFKRKRDRVNRVSGKVE